MSSATLCAGDLVIVHGVGAVVLFVGRLWAIVRVDGVPVRVDVSACEKVTRDGD